MATTIAQLQAVVGMNVKGVRDGAQETKGLLGGISAAFGDMGRIAGGVLGAQVIGKAFSAVTGFAKGAISAGSDATEMMGKFGVTFGGMAEGLTSDLADFAAQTGRSRYTLQGMAADFGAVLKGMQLSETQTADYSASLAKLAVDVGSFMNAQAPEVMNKFRAGITGEMEGLKSLGIVINQAMVEQELFNLGVVGGVKAATQAQLVQARYNLILAATKDAQGDATRTADSWANQTVALNSIWKDFMTDLGLGLTQGLGPVLKIVVKIAGSALPKLATALTGSVLPAVAKGAETLSLMASGFADAYDAMGGGFTGLLWGIANAIQMLVPQEVSDRIYGLLNSLETLKGKLPGVLASAGGAGKGLLSSLTAGMDLGGLGKIAGNIGGAFKGGGIGAAISAALGSAPDLAGTLGTLKGQLVDNLFSLGGDMLNALSTQFPGLAPIIEGGLKPLLDFGQTLFTSFSEIKGAAFDGLLAVLPALFTALGTAVQQITPFLPQLVTAILSLVPAILPLITQALPPLITLFTQVIGAILPPLMAMLPQLIPPILALVTALVPLIANVLPPLINLFMQVISAILPPVLALLPQLIPPVLSLIQAILPLIQAILPPLITLFTQVIGAILPPLLALLPTLIPPIMSLITAILPLIETVLPPLIELFTSVIGTILPPLLELLPQVIKPVVGLVEAFMPLIGEILPPLIELFSALIGLSLEVALKAIEGAAGLLGKAVETVTGLFDKAHTSMGGLGETIKKVTDWFGGLTAKVAAFKLPDVLTPGSPTPMENGLVGIGDALMMVTDKFFQFATTVSPERAKTMKDVGSSLKDLAKAIGEVVGSMVSLNAMSGPNGGPGDIGAKFAAYLALFETVGTMAMTKVQEIWDEFGYKRIHKLKLTAGRIKEIISGVLIDLSAIKERQLPDLGVWFGQLKGVFAYAADMVSSAIAQFGAKKLADMAEVAGNIAAMYQVINTGLDDIKPNLSPAWREAFTLLKEQLTFLASELTGWLGGFTQDARSMIANAAETATSLTQVFSLIGAAALDKIVPSESATFAQDVIAYVAQIGFAGGELTRWLSTIPETWRQVLKDVAPLSDLIRQVFGLLGIDLSVTLAGDTFIPSLTAYLNDLVAATPLVQGAIKELKALWASTEAMAEDAGVSETLKRVFSILDLRKTFDEITTQKALGQGERRLTLTSVITKLVDDLKLAAPLLKNGLAEVLGLFDGALETSITIGDQIKALFEGIAGAIKAGVEIATAKDWNLGKLLSRVGELQQAVGAVQAINWTPSTPGGTAGGAHDPNVAMQAAVKAGIMEGMANSKLQIEIVLQAIEQERRDFEIRLGRLEQLLVDVVAGAEAQGA